MSEKCKSEGSNASQIMAGLILSVICSVIVLGYGVLSERYAVNVLISFGGDLASKWGAFADHYKVSISRTSKGDLTPVITEQYDALDLMIYETEVMAPAFHSDYLKANLLSLDKYIYIASNDKGQSFLSVAGFPVKRFYAKEDRTYYVLYSNVGARLAKLISEEVEYGQYILRVSVKQVPGKYIYDVLIEYRA